MDADAVVRWFDPNASYKDAKKRAGAEAQGKRQKGPPPVWVQYVVFSLGVFLSPIIRAYRSSGHLPSSTLRELAVAVAFSLITGFIVFPRVIDTLAKPDASAFARLSTVFTAGVGWEQFSGLPAALAGKST
jgi:hypothetical protein